MDPDKPYNLLSREEQEQVSQHLIGARKYDCPLKVWVEDGHVFLEENGGSIAWMTPKVAIAMGRMLGEAGSDALINQAMDDLEK